MNPQPSSSSSSLSSLPDHHRPLFNNIMKKRMWSPEEDQTLKRYVEKHGPRNWNEVARLSGLQQRCAKSCRLRWVNFLRPGLKRGPFSPQDIRLLLRLHSRLGNRWSQIAAYMPGRSDNDVKNFWHTTSRRWRRMLHHLRSAQCTDEKKLDLITTQDRTRLESAEEEEGGGGGTSGGQAEELQQEKKSSSIPDTNLTIVAAPGSHIAAHVSTSMPPNDPPEDLHLVVWNFMNRKLLHPRVREKIGSA